MGWIIAGGILLFFVLLFSLSVAADIRYNGDFFVSVGILGWRYPIWPTKKKPESKKQKPVKKKVPQKSAKKKTSPKKVEKKPEKGDLKGLFQTVLDLLKASFPPLGKLIGKIRMTRLEAYILVGGEDAAQIATDYGKICGVFYGSYAALQNFIKVKVRKVDISCDFLLPETKEDISFTLKLRLGSILWAAICMGARFLVYTIRRGQETPSPKNQMNQTPKPAGSGVSKS